MMKVFKYPVGKEGLGKVLARSQLDLTSASKASARILMDVKARGDKALFYYTRRFDNFNLSKNNIRLSQAGIKKDLARVDKKLLQALRHASKNIVKYHRKQLSGLKKSWSITVEAGVKVGERILPIDSVGCYVPGGRASYPSTVLMTCIPAKIAGVKRIVVASPPPVSDAVIAACKICGVDEIYQIGGAQAIGALAYGTESIKRVSKIVGPGNKYVMAAKNMVYGTVDVDMPAGPSEVLIIADETTCPDFTLADLHAQAEHDPDAQCVLITTSRKLLESVRKKAPRNSVGILAGRINDCIEFANLYAPEHLQVMCKNASKIAGKIANAGAIFIGQYSPVAVGDYASGCNHVLPTGGAARFSSPLGVRDFLKACSVQKVSEVGIKKLGTTIMTLAETEKLKKHKKSIEWRL